MARYHEHATDRLSQSMVSKPNHPRRKKSGFFFRPIRVTLKDLLLTDCEVWVPRVEERPVTVPGLTWSPRARGYISHRAWSQPHLVRLGRALGRTRSGLRPSVSGADWSDSRGADAERASPCLQACNVRQGQIVAAITVSGFESELLEPLVSVFPKTHGSRASDLVVCAGVCLRADNATFFRERAPPSPPRP